MRVKVRVEGIAMQNNNGYDVASVCVTCSKCGCTSAAYGTSEASIKRACASLAEDCGAGHFYVP